MSRALNNDTRPYLNHCLEGCRVIDFGHVWAGPALAAILGDMGAEVIKVETRKQIDSLRLSPDNLHKDPEMDPWFHSQNRNKLSITLDVSNRRGVKLARELIKISDVVVENFAPGVMKRHGLGYESLRKINPKLIMIGLPGTGNYGPLRDVVTYATSIQGLSGLDNMIGYLGERVLGMQCAIADGNSAAHGAFAVLAALYYRNQTGKGQYIDLAQMESMICCLGEGIMEYTMNKRVMERGGNINHSACPHGNYRCRGDDKWVSIAIVTEEEWLNFCEAIGNPPWTKRKQFINRQARLKNSDLLDRHITEWTINHTHYEATDILQRFGVASMPCLDTEERYFNPHLQERECHVDFNHPVTGTDVIAGTAWKLSETPGKIRRHAPLLGEHNHYVFIELLGMHEDIVKALMKEQIIY